MKRPNKEDYDFNDVFAACRYANDMNKYADHLEAEQLPIHGVVSSKTTLEKPTQLKETDLSKLREVCQNYIDFIDNDSEYHEDNDFSNYIFEQALEVIYGEDVWNFVNNRQD